MATRIVAKHLPESDYRKLMDWATARPRLDSLVLLLLLKTGMRQDELVRLTAESFNLGEGRVFIAAAKGSISRWLPIGQALSERIRIVLPDLSKSGSFGRMISDSLSLETQKRTVRRWVDAAIAECLGPNQYTTHSLRHTFALRCLKAMGNDIIKVQLAMGHKNVSSTARYLQYLKSEEIHDEILKAVE